MENKNNPVSNIINVERKECDKCGITFLTKDKNEKLCLGCKVIEEMKLSDDTIINQNVFNIYMRGAYDRIKGVDPIYLMVAEGVMLLNRKRKEEQLCSKAHFIGTKSNDEIENYVKMAHGNTSYSNKFDAMVFVKISEQSKFMIFGLSYSDRLYNILKSKPVLFKKNFAISLAIKWYYKDVIQ